MLGERMRKKRLLRSQCRVDIKKNDLSEKSSPVMIVKSLMNKERLKIEAGIAGSYSPPQRTIEDIQKDISSLFRHIRRPILSNREILLARSVVHEMREMVNWEVHQLASMPLSECDEKQISDLATILSTAGEIEKSYMRLRVRKGGVI